MNSKISLLAISLLALAGCNDSGSGGTSASTDTPANGKPLFSTWSARSGTQLELSGLQFGDNGYGFVMPTGECGCTLNLTGTQSRGTFEIKSCTNSSGTITAAECQALDQAGTYEKQENGLRVCTGGTCEDYS